jgi:hypothetical protein
MSSCENYSSREATCLLTVHGGNKLRLLTLHPTAAARTCRLRTVEKAPQEVRQNDENQGVQKQTAQLGNTLACGDPATEQLTGQLKCHGAGDGNKGGKGDDLLDWVHLLRT